MLLLIDNRDSFTFNLYQYLRELGEEVRVVRASDWSLARTLALRPSGVITGPGPGHPKEALLSQELALELPDHVPLLGVCLGHQALALAYGAKVKRCAHPMHGRSSALTHKGVDLFAELPAGFAIGRYHSLTVDPVALPAELVVQATTEDGEIQALRHAELPRFGVQFHPESILSEQGHALLANFVELTKRTPELGFGAGLY